MDIKITYKNQEYILKNVDIGGQIKWEYTTSERKKLIYWIKITNNEKTVCN